MRTVISTLLAATAILAATAPASAKLVGASSIDFTDTPFTFSFGGSDFTFSNVSTAPFDFDPVAVQTSGTGAVTAFGGFLGIPLAPSTFFTRANVEIGPNTAPGFASFTSSAVVPYSLSEGDLGLRVTIGEDNFYGYARFGGSFMQEIAFETIANKSITAGSLNAAPAVPEPTSWAMMIGGIGFAGGMLRRRRATSVRVAYA